MPLIKNTEKEIELEETASEKIKTFLLSKQKLK
jgi:hypothetical protein